MNQQVHNNERENRTQAMRFYAFTFTGKQRDAETRLSYFGARYSTSFRDVSWQRPQASLGALLLKRYYDADLATVWLSMDPMSDKYPSLSPYNYCAGNPVKLVDPDGREIDVSGMFDQNGGAKKGYELACESIPFFCKD